VGLLLLDAMPPCERRAASTGSITVPIADARFPPGSLHEPLVHNFASG
jgi:hypothetical protein